MDASTVSTDEIAAAIERMLDSGLAYFCAWGPDCERVHDIADEVLLRRRPEANYDTDVMTTWHDDESLADAAWFASIAFPADEYVGTFVGTVAMLVGLDADAEQQALDGVRGGGSGADLGASASTGPRRLVSSRDCRCGLSARLFPSPSARDVLHDAVPDAPRPVTERGWGMDVEAASSWIRSHRPIGGCELTELLDEADEVTFTLGWRDRSDQECGVWVAARHDGQWCLERFEQGHRDGPGLYFSADDVPVELRHYSHGVPDGPHLIFRDGVVVANRPDERGKRSDQYQLYHPNGTVWMDVTFSDAVSGVAVERDHRGRVVGRGSIVRQNGDIVRMGEWAVETANSGTVAVCFDGTERLDLCVDALRETMTPYRSFQTRIEQHGIPLPSAVDGLSDIWIATSE
jgi:hypothetical protein